MLSIVVMRGRDMRRALESFLTAWTMRSMFQSKMENQPVTPPAEPPAARMASEELSPSAGTGVPLPPPPREAPAYLGPFSPAPWSMTRCAQSMPVS